MYREHATPFLSNNNRAPDSKKTQQKKKVSPNLEPVQPNLENEAANKALP